MYNKTFKDIDEQTQLDIASWYKNHSARSTRLKFNICQSALKKILDKFSIDKHTKAESTKLGMLENYGVYNIAQSEYYKDKLKNRSKEEVERSNTLRKQTNLKRYGKEHILQTDFGQQHRKETSIQRFGLDNIFKTEQFKELRKTTNIKKYGAEFPMQTDEYKENYRKKCIDKYGKDNIFKSEIFKETRKLTVLEKFNEEFQSLYYDKEKSVEFLSINPLSINQLSKRFNVTIPTVQAWVVRHELQPYLRPERSSYERIIKDLFPQFIRNSRKVLGNGQELDFYNSQYKIAIEFNGDFYHSTAMIQDKYYHLNKSKLCENLGIRLIHIYEYEWNNDRIRNILISMINESLGIYKQCFSSETCNIRCISNAEALIFNNENSITPYQNADIAYGLFWDNSLIQIVGFTHLETSNNWVMINNCTKLDVCIKDGFLGLFSYFIEHNNPYSISADCDFNKVNGIQYEELGMKFVRYTGPKKLALFKSGKVISLISDDYSQTLDDGYAEIWGAGNKEYIWRKQ